jgi:two-component sensor histidine kinase
LPPSIDDIAISDKLLLYEEYYRLERFIMWGARQPGFVERNLAEPPSPAVAGDADGPEPPKSVQDLLRILPAFRGPVAGREIQDAIIGQLAAVGLAGLGTAVRFALDPYLPPGFPFVTFFPCVVIAGFIWGLAPALTCAVLTGLAAWYWFIPPFGGFYLTSQFFAALAFYAFVVGIDLCLLQMAIFTARSLARTQVALRKSIALQRMVSAEVDHRLKNLFATVNGLISLSQKYAETPADLADQLRQRLSAMAQSAALLRGAAHGESPGLSEVIGSTLRPLGAAEGERVSLGGDHNALASSALIPLNLMFYELGTNSIKYGALSSEVGSVSIEWQVLASASPEPMLRVVWMERNGPKVVEPARSGFGTMLISRMCQSLGGSCEFNYLEQGLMVTLIMEGSRVLADGPSQELPG